MDNYTTRWILGHKVTPYFTSGDYDMMYAETPPHVPGPPPHSHHSYEESFLVIEGELEFMVNGEVKTLKAGESLDVPPHTVHTFGNASDQPCKWVNIHSPKGFMDFFASLGIPSDQDNAQERSAAQEVIDKVVQTAADHDMNIHM